MRAVQSAGGIYPLPGLAVTGQIAMPGCNLRTTDFPERAPLMPDRERLSEYGLLLLFAVLIAVLLAHYLSR
jgi:hypothetical protein